MQGKNVLDRNGHTRQDARVFTSCDLPVDFSRLLAGEVFGETDKGMHLLLFGRIKWLLFKAARNAIHGTDLRQGGFQDFTGA